MNNDKEAKVEYEYLDRLKKFLKEHKLTISFEKLNEDEEKWIKDLNLLTDKKVIFVLNISENHIVDVGEILNI